jgi:hypothetical protein
MADAGTRSDEAGEHNDDNADSADNADNTDELLSAGNETIATRTIGGAVRDTAPGSESLKVTLDTATATTGDDCFDLDGDSKIERITTNVYTTDSAVPIVSLKPSESMVWLRRSPHDISTSPVGAIRIENIPLQEDGDGGAAMEDDSVEEVSPPLEAYLAEPAEVQMGHLNQSTTPPPNNEVTADSANGPNVRRENKRTLVLAFGGIAALLSIVVLGGVCGSGMCRDRRSTSMSLTFHTDGSKCTVGPQEKCLVT